MQTGRFADGHLIADRQQSGRHAGKQRICLASRKEGDRQADRKNILSLIKMSMSDLRHQPVMLGCD
jgi:hypothetical protein